MILLRSVASKLGLRNFRHARVVASFPVGQLVRTKSPVVITVLTGLHSDSKLQVLSQLCDITRQSARNLKEGVDIVKSLRDQARYCGEARQIFASSYPTLAAMCANDEIVAPLGHQRMTIHLLEELINRKIDARLLFRRRLEVRKGFVFQIVRSSTFREHPFAMDLAGNIHETIIDSNHMDWVAELEIIPPE